MTIVIDVGAARYGEDYSMERLIEAFQPTILYAVDPNPALEFPSEVENVDIELIRQAAWTSTGTIGYVADGLNSWVTYGTGTPCFDLAAFIRDKAADDGQGIVLKLDAEGSEYELLPHLISQGVDKLLELAIVEWHPKTRDDAGMIRSMIEQDIRCELREWLW